MFSFRGHRSHSGAAALAAFGFVPHNARAESAPAPSVNCMSIAEGPCTSATGRMSCSRVRRPARASRRRWSPTSACSSRPRAGRVTSSSARRASGGWSRSKFVRSPTAPCSSRHPMGSTAPTDPGRSPAASRARAGRSRGKTCSMWRPRRPWRPARRSGSGPRPRPRRAPPFGGQRPQLRPPAGPCRGRALATRDGGAIGFRVGLCMGMRRGPPVTALSRDGGEHVTVDSTGAGFTDPRWALDPLGAHPREPETLLLAAGNPDGGDQILAIPGRRALVGQGAHARGHRGGGRLRLERARRRGLRRGARVDPASGRRTRPPLRLARRGPDLADAPGGARLRPAVPLPRGARRCALRLRGRPAGQLLARGLARRRQDLDARGHPARRRRRQALRDGGQASGCARTLVWLCENYGVCGPRPSIPIPSRPAGPRPTRARTPAVATTGTRRAAAAASAGSPRRRPRGSSSSRSPPARGSGARGPLVGESRHQPAHAPSLAR